MTLPYTEMIAIMKLPLPRMGYKVKTHCRRTVIQSATYKRFSLIKKDH